MSDNMKRVGEFCGCPVYIDYAGLEPGEIKLVSLTWDAFERRMREFDEVKIVNLKPASPPA